MGNLTALPRIDLSGDLSYTDRNIFENQTYTMRIQRFHETWDGSQASAQRWLPPVKALKQEGSI